MIAASIDGAALAAHLAAHLAARARLIAAARRAARRDAPHRWRRARWLWPLFAGER